VDEAITWYDAESGSGGTTAFYTPENGKWISGDEANASNVNVYGTAEVVYV
jgi:hypothetical protein